MATADLPRQIRLRGVRVRQAFVGDDEVWAVVVNAYDGELIDAFADRDMADAYARRLNDSARQGRIADRKRGT